MELSRTLRVLEAVNMLSEEPFQWGRADCCMFVARVVRSFCDDPKIVAFIAQFRHATRAEARGALSAYSGRISEMVRAALGEPCPIDQTHDGDPVVFLLSSGEEMLGIRLGDRVVYKTMRGVAYGSVHSSSIVFAWRIA